MNLLFLLILVIPWEPLVVFAIVCVARMAGLVPDRGLSSPSPVSLLTFPGYLHFGHWLSTPLVTVAMAGYRKVSGVIGRRSSMAVVYQGASLPASSGYGEDPLEATHAIPASESGARGST